MKNRFPKSELGVILEAPSIKTKDLSVLDKKELLEKEISVSTKKKLNIRVFVFRITTSLNNLFLTIRTNDSRSKTLFTISCGMLGFKGSLKAKYYAATQVGLASVAFFKKKFFKLPYSIVLEFKGHSKRRFAAFFGLSQLLSNKKSIVNGLLLHEITLNPYNGCRPKKKRRL